jgi:hypothetical protein
VCIPSGAAVRAVGCGKQQLPDARSTLYTPAGRGIVTTPFFVFARFANLAPCTARTPPGLSWNAGGAPMIAR